MSILSNEPARFLNIIFWNSWIYKGFSIKIGQWQAPGAVLSKIMGPYRSYKKIMKISKCYFCPGSPKYRFLRFFRNFFTKKMGWEYGNHEWDDDYGNLKWDDDSGNLEWNDGALLPRGNGFSVLRIFLTSPSLYDLGISSEPTETLDVAQRAFP